MAHGVLTGAEGKKLLATAGRLEGKKLRRAEDKKLRRWEKTKSGRLYFRLPVHC
jgi:hypothetical protein